MITVYVTLSCDYYENNFSCENFEDGFMDEDDASTWALAHDWIQLEDIPRHRLHLCPDHTSKAEIFLLRLKAEAKQK
jgi:hypothetical protein